MAFPLPETIVENVTTGHDDHHVDIHRLLNNNISSQTASYTLALTDFGKVVELNSASAVNLTVPPNSTVAFPVGTTVEVCQVGAGVVTVVQGAGVTVRTPGTLILRAQWSSVALRKRATDEWVLAGDTT